MGVQRTVTFPTAVPDWAAIAGGFGEPAPVVRMIDGLPAFPDEVPEAGWREVRLGFAGDMVTLRVAGPNAVAVVSWGTGEPALEAAVRRCVAALESAGGAADG